MALLGGRWRVVISGWLDGFLLELVDELRMFGEKLLLIFATEVIGLALVEVRDGLIALHAAQRTQRVVFSTYNKG